MLGCRPEMWIVPFSVWRGIRRGGGRERVHIWLRSSRGRLGKRWNVGVGGVEDGDMVLWVFRDTRG